MSQSLNPGGNFVIQNGLGHTARDPGSDFIIGNITAVPSMSASLSETDTFGVTTPPVFQKWLAPIAVQRFVDNSSHALVGGKIFTYASGGTNKLATYTDADGLAPNLNPIRLNARGETQIWLPSGVNYDDELTPQSDSDPPINPIWTVDQVAVQALVYWPKISIVGSPTASQLLFGDYAVDSVTYPANFSGGRFYARTAPASGYSLAVYRNDHLVGLISFSTGSHIATLATVGAQSVRLIEGDRFEVIAQGVPDGSIGDIYGTFAGMNAISGWP